MNSAPASPLRKRLNRFARWFFNVVPTAQLETDPAERREAARAATARGAAARAQSRAKQLRRRHPHAVPTTRAIRER
jgi:hypothetical protein